MGHLSISRNNSLFFFKQAVFAFVLSMVFLRPQATQRCCVKKRGQDTTHKNAHTNILNKQFKKQMGRKVKRGLQRMLNNVNNLQDSFH